MYSGVRQWDVFRILVDAAKSVGHVSEFALVLFITHSSMTTTTTYEYTTTTRRRYLGSGIFIEVSTGRDGEQRSEARARFG